MREINIKIDTARLEGREEIIRGIKMAILAYPPQLAKNGENLANMLLMLLSGLEDDDKKMLSKISK